MGSELLHLFLRRLLAQNYLRRVTRYGPHHKEHDDGHPEQHRDYLQYPAPDILGQGRYLLRVTGDSHALPARLYAPPPLRVMVLNGSPPVGFGR